jgi:hypothetical protein
MTYKLGFTRRPNPDSTTDSICLRCFRIVATEPDAINLEAAEQDHACTPEDELVRLRANSQAGSFWKA